MEMLPLEQLPPPVLPTCGEIRVLEMVSLLLSASGSSGDTSSSGEREEGEEAPSKQQQWAWIATALILLGHGYVDHAHNLVGPLSFHMSLPYFHGPTIATEPDILAAASFAHSLVHRREGPHPSEFGQTGFCNAQFWAGATLRSGGEETLPLYAMRSRIAQLASANGPEAQEWFRSNYGPGLLEEWDPRPLTELCEAVLPTATTTTARAPGAAGHRHSLLEFSEQAALAELQELLQDALINLGFSLPTCTGPATCLSSHQEESMACSPDDLLVSSQSSTTAASRLLFPTTLEEAGSSTGPFCDRPIVVTTLTSPHKIVLVNEAWTNMCGYTSQQAVGKTFSILHGPESNFAAAGAVARQCCDTRLPQEMHLVNYTAAGDRFVNHLKMAPLYVEDDTTTTTSGDSVNNIRIIHHPPPVQDSSSSASSPMRPSRRRPDYMVAILQPAGGTSS
jgi:PAS domain-containing protein